MGFMEAFENLFDDSFWASSFFLQKLNEIVWI
jgi:hypothetical protein